MLPGSTKKKKNEIVGSTLIEGMITLVFAGLCVFIVPKIFETAYLLTEEDRVTMRHRTVATANIVTDRIITNGKMLR